MYKEARKMAIKIARQYGLELEDIQGPRRTKLLVQARKDIIKALHKRGLSLSVIGWTIGRDHTTVLHHLKKKPPSS